MFLDIVETEIWSTIERTTELAIVFAYMCACVRVFEYFAYWVLSV